MSADAIDRRVAARRLHVLYRGVYAVGHTRICREGRWLASVLAGDGVLGYRAAAALWDIRQYDGRPEVIVPRGSRGRSGFIARSSFLEPDEITEHRGIPTTSVARTLLDLGAVLQPHQLDKAIRQADYLRLFDLSEVAALLERHPTKRGTKRLRKALTTAAAGMTTTRSDLEDRFRALVLTSDLPRPILNAAIALDEHTTIEPDALWPAHNLIVELDSRQAHDTQTAFEADRLRDRRLAALGYTVLRITDRQLTDAPDRVLADLKACTQPRSGRPPSAAPLA